MEFFIELLAGATWFIGLATVVARHYHRRRLPWSTIFQDSGFPFPEFNKHEWLEFLAVLGATVAIWLLGIVVAN